MDTRSTILWPNINTSFHADRFAACELVVIPDEQMPESPFDKLPGHVKRYIKKWGWSDEELSKWLQDKIPALGNRSVIEALSYGDFQSVNTVVLIVGDALGIEGGFD